VRCKSAHGPAVAPDNAVHGVERRWVPSAALLVAALVAGACLPGLPASKRAVLATRAPTVTPSPFVPPHQAEGTGEATLVPVPVTPQTGNGDCRQLAGHLVEDSVPSSLGGLPFTWIAYVPGCYDAQPEADFPLLLLFHAAGRDARQWLELGLPETADGLIAAGEIAPLVVVMPSSPLDNPSDASVLADLLPALASRYRLKEDRTQRALGGVSLGAAQVLRIALQRPDLFAAFGLHSLTPVEADLARVAGWLPAIPADLTPRVYVDIGDKDVQRDTVEALAQQLAAGGLPVTWQLNSGAHADSYWRAHAAEYLRWYAQGWR
jgi:enterochelin esterase-like enzyme